MVVSPNLSLIPGDIHTSHGRRRSLYVSTRWQRCARRAQGTALTATRLTIVARYAVSAEHPPRRRCVRREVSQDLGNSDETRTQPAEHRTTTLDTGRGADPGLTAGRATAARLRRGTRATERPAVRQPGKARHRGVRAGRCRQDLRGRVLGAGPPASGPAGPGDTPGKGRQGGGVLVLRRRVAAAPRHPAR